MVDELAQGDARRWLYGVETTSSNICGLALNELILHGRDLAAVTGEPDGVYHVRFRGGNDYT